MKLSEILEYFEKQEVTIHDYIKNQFNRFSTMGITEMDDTEAAGIYYVLENRIEKLLNCETIYSDEEEGVGAVQAILKHNIVNLVVEIRNMMKALSNDIATSHAQTKFNPIDNDNIDKAPIAMDNLAFTKGENLIAQCDYLNENSKTLGYIYSEFANMCYITGSKKKITSSSSSTVYATKTALNSEIESRKSADNTLANEIAYTEEEIAKKQDKIDKYCEDASVLNNTLTLQFSDSTTTSFTPTGTEGGITDVQITDSEGTTSVVTGGVASIDLTGYMTTSDANSKFEQVANKVTSLDSGATDTEYPSAKATNDKIEEVYNELNTYCENLDATKAADDSVVHLTGTETISGKKLFTGEIDNVPTTSGVSLGIEPTYNRTGIEVHGDNPYIDLGLVGEDYRFRVETFNQRAKLYILDKDSENVRNMFFPLETGILLNSGIDFIKVAKYTTSSITTTQAGQVGSVSITAPTIDNYTFVTWINQASHGVYGSCGLEDDTASTTSCYYWMRDAGTFTITATALYKYSKTI